MGAGTVRGWQGWGLTLLRVTLGAVFLAHGGQKLFIWGFAGVAAFLARIGVPAPALAGVVLTLVECVGGVALVLGLYTRWAAALLAADMLTAILIYHLPHGFFAPNGVEYPLTLLAGNLTLVLLGSGEAALDVWIRGL